MKNELPISPSYYKEVNLINYFYNEEFISLINQLSSSIKEYYHNYQLYINNIKAQTESITEQTLFSKSSVNDILIYLSQSKPKLSINTNENYIREKVYSISDRMDRVNEIKKSISYSEKSFEGKFNSFFGEAKLLFRKMKEARSSKIEELHTSNYEDYLRRSRDKATSHSPNSKKAIHRNKYNCANLTTQNNASTQLNSSFNSSQRVDSFNTFGSNHSGYTANVLSVSIDDIMKKNESLISETTLIKYKYDELSKENEYLRSTMMKLKQDQHNPLVNKGNRDREDSRQEKARSLSKKKCSTIDNEPEKEDKRNKRGLNEVNNPLLMSCPPTKNSKQQVKHKRAYSIDNNNSSNTTNNNVQSQSKPNPLQLSSTSTNTIDINALRTLSNSNSTNSKNYMTMPIPSSHSNSFNLNSQSNVALASLVLSFLSQMKSLQESISSHSDNIKEMKKSFEVKKRELTKLSEAIISSGPPSTQQTSTSSSSVKKQSVFNDKQLAQLELEVKQLKASNSDLIQAIQKEKEQSSLAESALTNEKAQNGTLKESIESLEAQMKEIVKEAQEQKDKIDQQSKENGDLSKAIERYKEKSKEHEAVKTQYEALQKSNEALQHEFTKLTSEKQSQTEELTSLKAEIHKLKQSIIEANQTMSAISKTNEAILNEKDHIIKNMSNNTLELKKEIELLTTDLKSQKDSASSLQKQLKTLEASSKEKSKQSSENKDKEISSLKEAVDKYKSDSNEAKKENNELINKLSELKNSYMAFNEERDALKQKLIEINEEAEGNLKELQKKNKKLEVYKEEYSNRLNEKIKDSAYNELKYSSEEYINTLSLINQCNNEMKQLNKALEDKIQMTSVIEIKGTEKSIEICQLNQLNHFTKEEEMMKELSSLKENNEKLKAIISVYQSKEKQNSNSNNDANNNPNKTLSDINEQNSNFINDELSSVSGIFLEEKNEEGEKAKKPNQASDKDNNHIVISASQSGPNQKQCVTMPNVVHTEQLSFERKHSQSSLHSNDESKYQSTLKMMEDNEALFREQLNTIKTELKSTIEERNNLKRKCEDSSAVMTKDELFKLLKQTFEKLVDLIQMTGKVKDYVMMILKLLNYTDEEIQKAVTRKDKKTLFGIFK